MLHKYKRMLPNYADYNNEPKTWTKVTGYNQLAAFQKFSKQNSIEIYLQNYHVPYKSQ